jgi:transformer-2 protein
MKFIFISISRESRGFGFITYDDSKEANECIDALNKTEFEGKTILVEMSKRVKPHKPTPGVYLGPTAATSKRKDYRKRSRSRSNSYRKRRRYSRSRSRRR